jgi:uncharacterized protein
MTPEFVYPIRDLQNGLQEVRAPLSFPWLQAALAETGLAPAPGSSGAFDVRVTMSGKNVVVCGTVQATVLMECGRCLAETSVTVVGELALLLTPAKPVPVAPIAGGKARARASSDDKVAKARPAKPKRAKPNEGAGLEFGPDDANSDCYVGDEVVLDGFLREAILLELPIFPLCSEECPGIGAVPLQAAQPAEATPTLDPRLAPLLELQKKKSL